MTMISRHPGGNPYAGSEVDGQEPSQRVLDDARDWQAHRRQQFYPMQYTATGAEAAGSLLIARRSFGFDARIVLVDNPTGLTLSLDDAFALVPPNCYGYPVLCLPMIRDLQVSVLSGTAVAGQVVRLRASAADVPPSALALAGGGAGNPLAVTVSSSASEVGSTNAATINLVAGAVALFAAARPTRTGIVIVNEDATNSIRVGPHGAISTTVGLLVFPKASVALTEVGQIDFVAVAGTPAVSGIDEYN